MSSPSCSCSHWWHAPFYIAATVALLVASFSTPPSAPSHRENHLPDLTLSATSNLAGSVFSQSAALALHRSGFHLAATVLQVSPESFLPIRNRTTIFALPDVSVSALSYLRRQQARDVLRYHAIPGFLPFDDLVRFATTPKCIATTLGGSRLLLESVGSGSKVAVLVNRVRITKPDIFLNGSHAVHGIEAALCEVSSGGDIKIAYRRCDGTGTVDNNFAAVIPWDRLIRALSSRGFTSFAVGLNSVLTPVARDFLRRRVGNRTDAGGITVFAPIDAGFDYVASPRAFLERAIRSHLVVGRTTYKQLAAMRLGEGMQTMEEGGGGTVRVTSLAVPGLLAVNGVEITDPDAYIGGSFVVHGVRRALQSI